MFDSGLTIRFEFYGSFAVLGICDSDFSYRRADFLLHR